MQKSGRVEEGWGSRLVVAGRASHNASASGERGGGAHWPAEVSGSVLQHHLVDIHGNVPSWPQPLPAAICKKCLPFSPVPTGVYGGSRTKRAWEFEIV